MNRLAATALSLAAAGFAGACNPELNIVNPNAPDVERAISTPGDVRNLIGSSYNTWHRGEYGGGQPRGSVMVANMADNLSQAFGNFGARFNAQEPRLAFNNSSAGDDGLNASIPYDAMYGALGAANDGLSAIKRGVKVQLSGAEDETPQMQALAYLVQGLTLGYLGLFYDRGFIVDEDTEQGTTDLQPYTAVTVASVAKFDKAIAASAGKSWTIPEQYTPGMVLTASKFNAMANTMAARVVAYTPRTPTETVAWAKVLGYAEKGISVGTPFNLTVTGDGGNVWYDLLKFYGGGSSNSWCRVDQRVIQLMDPTQPVVYTSTTPPPRATSADARLASDFRFVTAIPFQAARGVFFFSQWRSSRYGFTTEDLGIEFTGDLPYVLAAENDLLLAEALIRTNGDKGRAASLINKTRVGRGSLSPLSGGMSNNELLGALFYEREIELFLSGAGVPWFDRRRIDTALTYNGLPIGNTWGFRGGSGLQKGTPRHLPVPAKELETLALPLYTYGGNSPNPVFPEM